MNFDYTISIVFDQSAAGQRWSVSWWMPVRNNSLCDPQCNLLLGELEPTVCIGQAYSSECINTLRNRSHEFNCDHV